MHFLQAVQAPVVRAIPPADGKPGRMLVIPKFEIDEFIEWGSEIEQTNIDRVVEGLSEIKAREYLSLYPPSSPDLNELRRYVYTSPGIKRIVRSCMIKASVFELVQKVKTVEKTDKNPKGEETTYEKGRKLAPMTEEEVDLLIKSNGTGSLAQLAFDLADLIDRSAPQPQAVRGGGTQSPLSGSGRQPTQASSGTGSTTSQSSTSPTPDEISGNAP